MINKTSRAPRAKKLAKSKYTKKQISEAIQKWTRVLESMNESNDSVKPMFHQSVPTQDVSSFNLHDADLICVQFDLTGYAHQYTCAWICPKENMKYVIEKFMLNIMKDGYVDMLGGEVDDLENNAFMKPAVFAPKIYKVIDWISSHYDGNHGSTYAHKNGFCVDGKDSIKVAPETYIQISVYQINEAMLDDVDDVMMSIPTTAFTSYSFD